MKRVAALLAVLSATVLSIGTAMQAAAAPPPPFTQCPPVGLDTSCAVLIVFNPDGSRVTLADPSQPAFDGVEDTLVGVQNNSSSPISSLALDSAPGSPIPIFAFDGDGLCTSSPRPAGCPFGPTGYEGQGTGFTGISTDLNHGTVVFSPPIPAGGSRYFSLEGPTASIAPPVEQPISAQGTTLSATEGQAFTATVATFTDPDPSSTAAEYSATINWGDGSPTSAGTISGPTGGPFTVSGSHTYAEEGTYRITVTITDVDTPSNTAMAISTANVADAALSARPACPVTRPQSFNGPTATFSDAASPFGTLSDFSASINWGDGSGSAGTVSGPVSGGPYTVSGSHTYASTGTFTITTTIKDVGGSTASTSCKTLVFAFAPGGGSFVIGDKNAVVGNSVTFWGAQWRKDNQLSGGPAPASFKGFAENPKAPSCGANWSTDPGNSTPPPPGPLPAFMGVIVTSRATKSGSEIDGNTVHIAVVQTNPGYQANPGHPGTGKVVAIVC